MHLSIIILYVDTMTYELLLQIRETKTELT